jgi:hypothetical protein
MAASGLDSALDTAYAQSMKDVVIDRNTGMLKILSRGWEFGPHLSLEAFQNSASAAAAQRISEISQHYRFRTTLSDEWFCGLVLLFNLYMLREILLGIRENEPTSWADWSKQGEDAQKQIHDQFLLAQLGPPPHNFGWGRAASVIDPHGYHAVIMIKYP